MIHAIPRSVLDRLLRMLTPAFSKRTLMLLAIDAMRLQARLRRSLDKPHLTPPSSKMHLGCGERHVDGWLNADLLNSDFDLDLANGSLPWKDKVFEIVVSQHVIEHLDLHDELLPLLRELHRVMRPGGELWLSCPDMAVVCHSYLKHRGQDLLDDRLTRAQDFSLGDDVPVQQMINECFHQKGQHKNLFDFDLLAWALQRAGFSACEHVDEQRFKQRFESFPPRHDDYMTLYVKATR